MRDIRGYVRVRLTILSLMALLLDDKLVVRGHVFEPCPVPGTRLCLIRIAFPIGVEMVPDRGIMHPSVRDILRPRFYLSLLSRGFDRLNRYTADVEMTELSILDVERGAVNDPRVVDFFYFQNFSELTLIRRRPAVVA